MDCPFIVYSSCMKMGLIHDLAESIVGDITPVDNVTEEDKYQRERVYNLHSFLFTIRMPLSILPKISRRRLRRRC